MKKLKYQKPAVRKDKVGIKFMARRTMGSELSKGSINLAAAICC
jgi:hypothetical protein